MRRYWILFLGAALLSTGGCSRSGGGVKLRTDVDSVAYVIGLNVGANLVRMDSTLNVAALCKGIADCFAGRPAMTMEEAQTFYLRYVNHAVPERIREQERQFLDDATAGRGFRQSDSGLRYDVVHDGDLKRAISSDDDRIAIRLKALRRDGAELYSSYERGDTLRTRPDSLPAGLREGLKLLGSGGAVKLWIPAALAYGAEGDPALGVGANETLYCEAELLDVRSADSAAGRRTDF